MRRINLVAGHGAGDPGARAIDGRWERDLVRQDVERLRQIFAHNNVPHTVYPTALNLFLDMKHNRNNWRSRFLPGDIVFEHHLNAHQNATANGTETFVAFRKLLYAINKRIIAGFATRFRKRGRKIGTFRTINTLKNMVYFHVLSELCFISNRNDFNNYINNRNAILLRLARDITGNPNLRDVGVPAPQPQVPATPPAVTGQNVLQYSVHVQNRGWLAWVRERIVAGTTGLALRLEAIRIAISNIVGGGGIRYRVHVQNKGWMDWVANGAIAGTTGRSLRVEAIRIELTGELARTHRIEYRVHVQNIGWMDWVRDGAIAGTTGRSLRMEAIEIRLERR